MILLVEGPKVWASVSIGFARSAFVALVFWMGGLGFRVYGSGLGLKVVSWVQGPRFWA